MKYQPRSGQASAATQTHLPRDWHRSGKHCLVLSLEPSQRPKPRKPAIEIQPTPTPVSHRTCGYSCSRIHQATHASDVSALRLNSAVFSAPMKTLGNKLERKCRPFISMQSIRCIERSQISDRQNSAGITVDPCETLKKRDHNVAFHNGQKVNPAICHRNTDKIMQPK
jgi:hypothetical protein